MPDILEPLQSFDTKKPLANILRHQYRNKKALDDAQEQLIGLHIDGDKYPTADIAHLLQQPIAEQLQYLHISNTQLQTLTIPRLPNLIALDLSENAQLQTLTFADALPKLQNLWLYGCNLTALELPAGFNQLQTLIAYDNPLTDVRLQGNCPHLRRVELHRNENLQSLEMPGTLHALEEVYLDTSERLQNIPPEILKQGAKGVAVYFKEKDVSGTEKIYEAKVLILGESGAGKTTLLRKLMQGINAPMPTDAESTKGIDIVSDKFLCQDADGAEHDFIMYFWDFGGQEIYHATHQFFLTKRSLYILVTDERKENTDFNYWLQVVELLSDNSPLIIVQNEKGGRTRDINISRLKGRFGNIQTTHSFDLSKDESALKKLLQDIKYQLSQLSHIGEELPKTWTDIRKKLTELKAKHPHITRQKYNEVCEKHGLDAEKAKTLGQYLHDLGAFLYFQDDKVLKNYVFLENEWVTNGVYDVLDHADIKNAKGHFDKKMAATIWKSRKYSDMHDELLALMAKFELCYEIPDKKDHFIAPQLLSVQDPPSVAKWNNDNNLQLRYEYEFMPKGILSRLIVRLHRHIHNAQNEAWKTGAIFTRQDAKIKVVESYDARSLELRGTGAQVRDLMTIVADEIDALNSTYPNLTLKKMIPCICEQCKNDTNPYFYKYNDILRRKISNRKTVECEVSFEDVEIDKLLDNVFTESHLSNKLLVQMTEDIKQQARSLATKQEFSKFFALLDPLNLQEPTYYKLKKEFATGTYRQDADYTERMIIFSNDLNPYLVDKQDKHGLPIENNPLNNTPPATIAEIPQPWWRKLWVEISGVVVVLLIVIQALTGFLSNIAGFFNDGFGIQIGNFRTPDSSSLPPADVLPTTIDSIKTDSSKIIQQPENK